MQSESQTGNKRKAAPAKGGLSFSVPPRSSNGATSVLYNPNPPSQEGLQGEIVGGDVCTAADITAHGNTPVLELCRLLVAAGHDPATPLKAFHGGALALHVRSIGEGAQLTVRGNGHGFEPSRGRSTGPPVRLPERRAPWTRPAPPAHTRTSTAKPVIKANVASDPLLAALLSNLHRAKEPALITRLREAVDRIQTARRQNP
jgi:hypothetical protein